MATLSTFSVSDLSTITDIDHRDVLLVSDYRENDGKYYSRKMDFGLLMDTISWDGIISASVRDPDVPLGQAVSGAVCDITRELVEREVERIFSERLSAGVLSVIGDNIALIWDAMDGRIDDQNVIRG